ncbi:hypothetical protein BH09MYX1_BH09MYX1_17880 [soil metagenome]
MRRSTLFGLILGGSAIGVWASCAVYDTSLLTSADSGVDAGKEGGPDAFACNAATYPVRPDFDELGADAGDLVFAVKRFDFPTDGGTISQRGFDLDRACTCPGAGSCVPPKGASASCDDDAGRDNAGGQLLTTFTSFATSYNPDKLNTRIQAGEFDLLVRVRNYNGASDDTSVEAALYLSNGTEPAADGGAPNVPKFDGTDVWTVDPRSLLGGIAPPYIPQPNSVDTAAYVHGGVLVASLANADIEFAAGAGLASLKVNMSGVVVTGRITMVNGVYTVSEGTLSGRWPARKFLTALQAIKVPLTTEYLCGDSGTYESIKALICKSLDIVSSPQNDNTNAPCDSLSLALGFEAVQISFGSVKAGPGAIQPCGATWTDACEQ